MKRYIEQGHAVLGLELGSTRIKAVLIGEDHTPIASGEVTWENQLKDGVWTYPLEDAIAGVQAAYASLKKDVEAKSGAKLTKLAALGFSAMMHGYLPFDREGRALCEFRTWRNTMTAQAAAELTELFAFNIPQRWSIAHLYQAMLKKEAHLDRIAYLTTLAGYVHERLTGVRALGVGEASGMFPIDSETNDYDQRMVDLFDQKAARMGYDFSLRTLLPRVLTAGENAGCLTKEGSLLLDPTGELEPGAPIAPPEGDAGTGMTATNAVAARTGNVSAGTSVFAMIVLEKPLSKVYPQIDMVTTPTGKAVAMVHCNNCTSDINAFAGMLSGFAKAVGANVSMGDIYTALFTCALKGEADCGGVINVPMLSGEPVVGLDEGRPLLLRTPDAQLTFENFARSLIAGAMISLRLGMELLKQEDVKIDSLLGHGGYFKTPLAGQQILASTLNTPVSVMETAGEGGPWGMALLAAYRINKTSGQTLEDYLAERVFAGAKTVTAYPQDADVSGLEAYTARFASALEAERAACAHVR